MHYQQKTSNAKWMTLQEVFPEEAEDIVMCSKSQYFDRKNQVPVSNSFPKQMRFQRSDSNVNLDIVATEHQTQEWTLEFWFKYAPQDFNPSAINQTLYIARHGSCVNPGVKFVFTLNAVSVSPSNNNRYPKTDITDDANGAFTASDSSQVLDEGFWYHYSIVNYYLEEKLTVSTNFIPISVTGSTVFGMIPDCPLQLGDYWGNQVDAYQDIMIFIRELRTWNMAKTQDELKYQAVYPQLKDARNLMAYYKLSESDTSIYEKLKSSWSYTGASQETFDSAYVKFEIDGSDYFMNDCSPGMTIGAQNVYLGCNPYTNWLYTDPALPTATIQHDLTAKLFPLTYNKDLQLTIGIYTKALQDSESYTIFAIQNLIELSRQADEYTMKAIVVSGNQSTTLTGTFSYTPTIDQYHYLFITIDQAAQKVSLIIQSTSEDDQTVEEFDLSSYSFRRTLANYNLIIGDSSTTTDYKQAFSQLFIFNKILSVNEIEQIAYLGVRSFSYMRRSLLYSYSVTQNDLIWQYDETTAMYDQQTKTWPWDMTTYASSDKFAIDTGDFKKISICPEGYSLRSKYDTEGQEYAFCVEKGTFFIRNGTLSLETVTLKDNVRYAWSFYERFKLFNLAANSGAKAILFEWDDVLKIELSTSTMTVYTYYTNGTYYSPVNLTSPYVWFNATSIAGIDGSWHSLSASLFNSRWYVYLDNSLIISGTDPMYAYNSASTDGDTIEIYLSGASSSSFLALSEVKIFGIPFSGNEQLDWLHYGFFETRLYEGIILAYYDFEAAFVETLNDLSIYSKKTDLSSILGSGETSNSFFWGYEEDVSKYFSSDGINVLTNNEGYQQVFSRDKSVLFKRQRVILSSTTIFNTEHTIELCYYIQSSTVVNTEIFGVYPNTVSADYVTNIAFTADQTQLVYTPIVFTGSDHFYYIGAGAVKTWECITAAASYYYTLGYFANFQREASGHIQFYDSSVFTRFSLAPLTNANRVITIAKDFEGSIRHVRIWQQYLKPGLARRFFRAKQLSFHQSLMALYFPLDEGIGDTFYDYVKGQTASFDSSLQPWVTLNTNDNKFEICEGERVYSLNGYCLNKEKFMKFGVQPLSFTVKSNPNASWPYLMTHSTTTMWINVKQFSSSSPNQNVFEYQISSRFTATLHSNKTFTIRTASGTTVLHSADYSSNFGQWNFLQIGCSSYVGACHVHWGTLTDDQWDIDIDHSGTEFEEVYDTEMKTTWTAINSCLIEFRPTSEDAIIALYMKELMIYSTYLPYKSTLLKLNLPIRPHLAPNLLVYLKMDEMSGFRLYNHASTTIYSVNYVDVSDISWAFFKESVSSSSDQFSNEIDYMYCKKENYTYIGDHCEYIQCHSDCYSTSNKRMGLCSGWSNSECAYLETTDQRIVYNSDANDYLQCYRYCLDCQIPYNNTKCNECIDGTYYYVDTQGLWAQPNMSCWAKCPISTYLDSTVTPAKCSDCPTYCECQVSSYTTCDRCMNSTFFYDRVRNQCLIECPSSTTYNNASETCESCSPACKECDGFTEYDCLECIEGLTIVPLGKTGKYLCVDKNCDDGYYFDTDTASCESCAQECETCTWSTSADCIKCTYGYQMHLGICKTCEDISADDERYSGRFSSTRGNCEEVCGDGFNMGANGPTGCDDGNTDSGDGCSSSCFKEDSWKCSGGSPTSRDVCISTLNPKLQISIIDTSSSNRGTIRLSFSLPVTFNETYKNTYRNYIKLYVIGTDQKNINYIVKLLQDASGSYYALISYTANFNNLDNSIVSNMFHSLGGAPVFKGYEIGNAPRIRAELSNGQQIQTIMETFENAMLSFLITNIVLGVILGDGLQHMWNLINYLQILYFLPLIQVKFHTLAQFAFKFLVFTTADFFEQIPQYLDIFINIDDLHDHSQSPTYVELQIEGVYMVTNYYQKFQVFIILIVVYPTLGLLSKLPWRWSKFVFERAFGYMKFNVPLQFFIELYLELAVVIWLNVYAAMNFNNASQTIASVLAMIVFFVVTYFPVWAYSVIMEHFDTIHLESFHKKFGALVESTKPKLHSTLNQMWVPLFLFRRYTYAAIIVVLDGSPSLQLILCLAQSLLVIILYIQLSQTLGFIIRVKPFESWELNFLYCVNECTIFVAFLITCFFMLDYNEEEGNIICKRSVFQLFIAWCLISTISLDIVINIGFVIYDLIRKFKKLIKTLILKYMIYVRRKLGQPVDDLIEEQRKLQERTETNQSQDSRDKVSKEEKMEIANEESKTFQPKSKAKRNNPFGDRRITSQFDLLVDQSILYQDKTNTTDMDLLVGNDLSRTLGTPEKTQRSQKSHRPKTNQTHKRPATSQSKKPQSDVSPQPNQDATKLDDTGMIDQESPAIDSDAVSQGRKFSFNPHKFKKMSTFSQQTKSRLGTWKTQQQQQQITSELNNTTNPLNVTQDDLNFNDTEDKALERFLNEPIREDNEDLFQKDDSSSIGRNANTDILKDDNMEQSEPMDAFTYKLQQINQPVEEDYPEEHLFEQYPSRTMKSDAQKKAKKKKKQKRSTVNDDDDPFKPFDYKLNSFMNKQ